MCAFSVHSCVYSIKLFVRRYSNCMPNVLSHFPTNRLQILPLSQSKPWQEIVSRILSIIWSHNTYVGTTQVTHMMGYLDITRYFTAHLYKNRVYNSSRKTIYILSIQFFPFGFCCFMACSMLKSFFSLRPYPTKNKLSLHLCRYRGNLSLTSLVMMEKGCESVLS
jgi:hypothetical protein